MDVDPQAGQQIYDELFEPLALAIGRMVVGTVVLEKTLMVEIVQRRVSQEGLDQVFGEEGVSRLERKSAGRLLQLLRDLGLEDQIAVEIAEVISTRNHFVHHLFDDPEFIRVFATREGVDQLVDRVEATTGEIYRLVKTIEPETISGAEAVFGISSIDLLRGIKRLDLDEDDRIPAELRAQLEALREIPEHLIAPPGGADS